MGLVAVLGFFHGTTWTGRDAKMQVPGEKTSNPLVRFAFA